MTPSTEVSLVTLLLRSDYLLWGHSQAVSHPVSCFILIMTHWERNHPIVQMWKLRLREVRFPL